MTIDPASLAGGPAADFLRERHLATLTTLRADGTPHVVPVGFTYDAATGLARVICGDGSQKVRNIERSVERTGHGAPVALSQLDGARWLTLEGTATVHRTPEAVAEAERRYGARYRDPRPNPQRVVIEVRVERVLGRP